MILYDFPLSGNAYKARLMLGLLGLPYTARLVDLRAREQKQPEFLRLNPRGQVPVLVDGEVAVADSQAILVYLARKTASESWLPTDAAAQAGVVSWLSYAANEIAHGPAAARLHKLFKTPLDYDAVVQKSLAVLDLLEGWLREREWLEQGRPTIADVAVYPYVAMAPQGGVTLDGHPQVQRWIARLQALPGYVPLPA